MSRKTSNLYTWELAELPVAEVIKKIEALPEHLRSWAGRLVWWDRYSEREEKVEGFDHWIEMRNDPDVQPLELTQALVSLGYTERYAAMRAGLESWKTGPQQPLVPARKHPEGTVFPIDIGPMRLVEHHNPKGGWHGYVVRRRKNNAKRSFCDYFKAMDYAMDTARKIEAGEVK
jgi:hypothetical protein